MRRVDGELRGDPSTQGRADDDRVIPIEHGRIYAERIPDATLQVVEDCGHAMYFERTDAFADAVTDFLLSGSESAT